MTLTRVSIEPLESGYVVTELYGSRIVRRAEPTWEGALTLAARALGVRRVIRLDPEPPTVDPVEEARRALIELGLEEPELLRAGGSE